MHRKHWKGQAQVKAVRVKARRHHDSKKEWTEAHYTMYLENSCIRIFEIGDMSSVLHHAPWEFLYNSPWDRSSNLFYVEHVVEGWCQGKKVAERGNPFPQIQEWVDFNCSIFCDRQRMNKNSHLCLKGNQWWRWRQKGIHTHSCLHCYRSSNKRPHQASFQRILEMFFVCFVALFCFCCWWT